MAQNKVLHVSTECYPAAKAGGMGDVVGALPLYLPAFGIDAHVIIPKYKTAWFESKQWDTLYAGHIQFSHESIHFEVQTLKEGDLGFPFFCIDIPGKFDRDSIYLNEHGEGFGDEPQRNIAFQRAVLEFILHTEQDYSIIHCHDHMTGLIPFMINHCYHFGALQHIKTIFTIHNGAYQGQFGWHYSQYIEQFPPELGGYLEWDGIINCQAAAIKCCDSFNTVSPNYKIELQADWSNQLCSLYNSEGGKFFGILNGIDTDLWDPKTDKEIASNLVGKSISKFKTSNKNMLLKQFNLKGRRPLFGFISRLAHQKGADILFDALGILLKEDVNASFIVLGSGDKHLEAWIESLSHNSNGSVGNYLGYSEPLSHQIYASTDFLLMPSRFEPCGLNQMFAMRYGSIPIVSEVGGLVDTITDIDNNGTGIFIHEINAENLAFAIKKGIKLYANKSKLASTRNKIMNLDNSWDKAAEQYAQLYVN
jgi:starch synthase